MFKYISCWIRMLLELFKNVAAHMSDTQKSTTFGGFDMYVSTFLTSSSNIAIRMVIPLIE